MTSFQTKNSAEQISLKRILLRPKCLDDAWDDYRWRKDPVLAYLDATAPVSIAFEEFLGYYREELERQDKNYIHFAIETEDGKHIGNCMLYDIDEETKEAQIGILIGEQSYWDKGYGQEAVMGLLEKAFRDMNLSRIHLNTLHNNTRAQRCFARCGFRACGEISKNGFNLIMMEIYRSQWQSPASSCGSETLKNDYPP